MARNDNLVKTVDEIFDSIVKSRFIELLNRYKDQQIYKANYEEICTIITDGEHATPKRSEFGIHLLSARNIVNHSLNLNDVDFIPIEEYERISKRIVPITGDILISCSGTIGRVCTIPANFKCQMVRSVALLRLKDDIDRTYFEWLVDSTFTQNQISNAVHQSAQANLFQGKIRKLVAVIPPIDEQKEFAQFVKQVDKSKVICKQMVSRFDDLVKSRFIEMFGKLEKGSFKYPACKLSDICDGRSSTIQINKMKDNDGEFPLFGASGIVKKIDSFSQNKEYVGIVKDGAGVGRVSHYPAYSSIVGTMAYLVPKDNCTISYLEQTLKMMDLGNSSTGSTIPHIYFKDYGKTLIPLPPIDMQNKFEMFVEQVNKSKSILLDNIVAKLSSQTS